MPPGPKDRLCNCRLLVVGRHRNKRPDPLPGRRRAVDEEDQILPIINALNDRRCSSGVAGGRGGGHAPGHHDPSLRFASPGSAEDADRAGDEDSRETNAVMGCLLRDRPPAQDLNPHGRRAGMLAYPSGQGVTGTTPETGRQDHCV